MYYEELKENIASFTKNQLKYLEETIIETKPNNVIELGSGVTTELLRKYNFKTLISIEHDYRYLDKEKTLLPIAWNNSLSEEKYQEYGKCLIYVGLEELLEEKNLKFDLVIIDGPYSFQREKEIIFHRIQLISLIPYLNPRATIFIHDTERLENRNTCFLFEKRLNRKFVKYKMKDSLNKQLTVYKLI